MKEGSLMRVLFCKIHCPFICFCKPSAAHLYTPGPLKLENTRHVPASTLVSVPGASNQQSCCGEVKEESLDGNQPQPAAENGLRSCIRKGGVVRPESSMEIDKKKVQWLDNIGKELAEIKEFESSETGDTDIEDESRNCLCIIL